MPTENVFGDDCLAYLLGCLYALRQLRQSESCLQRQLPPACRGGCIPVVRLRVAGDSRLYMNKYRRGPNADGSTEGSDGGVSDRVTAVASDIPALSCPVVLTEAPPTRADRGAGTFRFTRPAMHGRTRTTTRLCRMVPWRADGPQRPFIDSVGGPRRWNGRNGSKFDSRTGKMLRVYS